MLWLKYVMGENPWEDIRLDLDLSVLSCPKMLPLVFLSTRNLPIHVTKHVLFSCNGVR
jgi:hypothetical protein